jgi:hypothetical protein
MNDVASNRPSSTNTTPAVAPRLDLEGLRLTQDYASKLGVKKMLTTVPVRKPNGQEFVRVHPGEDYRLQTAVLVLKEDRETYLVDPALRPALAGEIVPVEIVTTINRQGVLAVWPIKLPGEDGKVDAWNASAIDAAGRAQRSWVRVKANMGLGAYEIFEAAGELPDPEWPDLPFQQILETAFKGKYITDLNHPVIRRLRGQ